MWVTYLGSWMTTCLGKSCSFGLPRAFRKLLSIYVFSYFPFGFEGRIWDLIVSVPDHLFTLHSPKISLEELFWTDQVHTPMNDIYATLCVSDVIYKCNSWLANVTFDWRHVIVKAVESHNQTRRIITFLRRLFARFKSKFHIQWTNLKRCQNKV